MRYAAVVVVLIAVSGCALPARDNKNDPANRPDATLTISPPEGSPHTIFTFHVTSPANVASKLDLDGDGVFETDMPNNTFVGEIPHGIVAAHLDSAGVGSFTLDIAATATSAIGHTEVSSSVRVHNTAPTLNLGPDVITSAYERRTVRLDPCGETLSCPSPDPDGSAGLTYTWKQLAGTPVFSGVVQSSSASFTAPLAPETLVFQLTVNDGFASDTEPLSVRVGHPGWLASGAPPRLFRFYPDSSRTEATAIPPIIATSTATNGDVWIISGTYNVNDWEADRISPSGTVVGHWPLSGGATFGAGGPIFGVGSSGGWALVEPGPNYQLELRRLAPISVGTAGTATPVALGFIPQRIVADPQTPGGVLAMGAGMAVRVAPDLTIGAPFNFPGGDFVTVANDGSVWSAFNTGGTQVQIHHLLPGDIDSQITLPGQISGLVPGSEGVLVPFGNGITLDYVQPLFDTTGVLPPPLFTPAINMQNGAQVVGNGDGDLYVMGTSEATLRRLHPHAGDFELAATTTFEQLGIAPNTGYQPLPLAAADAWNGGVLITGGVTPGDALYVRVPANGLPFEQALSILPNYLLTEGGRGSYWTEVSENGSSYIRRFDTRGSVLGNFQVPVTESGNLTFAPGSDGGVFFVTRTNSFTDSRLRGLSHDGTVLSTLDFPAENLLSIGLDGSGTLACVGTTDNAIPAVGHLRRVGMTQTEFASGMVFGYLPGVAATRSGACWGWLPGDLHVYYADAAGSAQIPFTNGAAVITADPYDDSAWIVDGSGLTVRHLAPSTGTELSSFALPASIGPSTPFARLVVTRACDPALAAGRPECRELWVTDTANPGKVFRLNGFGKTLASYPLAAGSAAFVDVR